MKRWLRRFLYLVILLVWLALISFPVFAFALSGRGQLTFGGQERYVRLFLVQTADVEGVGVEWTRPLSGEGSCSRTAVNYFTWRGQGEDVVYCQCADGDSVTAACNAKQ